MIETRRENGVLALTLSRINVKNALDVPTLRQLRAICAEAATDPAVRAVTLTGAGKVFSSGADVLEWAQAAGQGRLECYGWTEAAHLAFAELFALGKPTIALVNGAAVGGGLDLALACDFRLASENARFLPGYTGMAYAPDAGASWHLPRLIGAQAAKAFLFLDEFWDAAKAHHHGLVWEVHPLAELPAAGERLAARLAGGPTRAFAETKALLAESWRNDFGAQLRAEAQSSLRCGITRDGKEAVQAFRESRAPRFVGA